MLEAVTVYFTSGNEYISLAENIPNLAWKTAFAPNLRSRKDSLRDYVELLFKLSLMILIVINSGLFSNIGKTNLWIVKYMGFSLNFVLKSLKGNIKPNWHVIAVFKPFIRLPDSY